MANFKQYSKYLLIPAAAGIIGHLLINNQDKPALVRAEDIAETASAVYERYEAVQPLASLTVSPTTKMPGAPLTSFIAPLMTILPTYMGLANEFTPPATVADLDGLGVGREYCIKYPAEWSSFTNEVYEGFVWLEPITREMDPTEFYFTRTWIGASALPGLADGLARRIYDPWWDYRLVQATNLYDLRFHTPLMMKDDILDWMIVVSNLATSAYLAYTDEDTPSPEYWTGRDVKNRNGHEVSNWSVVPPLPSAPPTFAAVMTQIGLPSGSPLSSSSETDSIEITFDAFLEVYPPDDNISIELLYYAPQWYEYTNNYPVIGWYWQADSELKYGYRKEYEVLIPANVKSHADKVKSVDVYIHNTLTTPWADFLLTINPTNDVFNFTPTWRDHGSTAERSWFNSPADIYTLYDRIIGTVFGVSTTAVNPPPLPAEWGVDTTGEVHYPYYPGITHRTDKLHGMEDLTYLRHVKTFNDIEGLDTLTIPTYDLGAITLTFDDVPYARDILDWFYKADSDGLVTATREVIRHDYHLIRTTARFSLNIEFYWMIVVHWDFDHLNPSRPYEADE